MSATSKPKKRKGPSAAQTMGGVLFGFEQQVWRTVPPPHELVHHARPDAPVPAGDGSFLTISMPGDVRLIGDAEPAGDEGATESEGPTADHGKDEAR